MGITKTNHYLWQGITPEHKTISGEVEAATVNLAISYLQQQHINVVSIKKKNYLFKQSRITTQDLILFFRQLKILIAAGIPIATSCHILEQSQEKRALRLLIQTLKKEMENGKSFTSCLQKFPQYFNVVTCTLLEAAEESGTLEIMLERIGNYLANTYNFKRKMIQNSLYPLLIGITAITVIFVMLIFIVPRFEELFSTATTLPLITRILFSLSWILRNYYVFMLMPLFILLGTWIFFKDSQQLKFILDSILIRLPGIKTCVQKFIFSRLARTLASLISAGIPIVSALTLSNKVCSNQHYIAILNQVSNQVKSGQQLHSAMAIHPLFPKLIVHMVKTGEESGSLDLMLNNIAELYESDLHYLFINLNQMVEPMVILLMGLLVGIIVIALYLPLFKLGTVLA